MQVAECRALVEEVILGMGEFIGGVGGVLVIGIAVMMLAGWTGKGQILPSVFTGKVLADFINHF